MFGDRLLSKDWAKVHEKGGILAAAALENWTAIYFFSHRFVHSCICPDDQIDTFMASDPSRQQFVERKARDWKAYQNECRRCGLDVDSDDESDEAGFNESNNNSEKTNKEKGLAATRWDLITSALCRPFQTLGWGRILPTARVTAALCAVAIAGLIASKRPLRGVVGR